MGAAFKLSHEQSPSAQVFQLTSSGIAYASLSKFAMQILQNLVIEEDFIGSDENKTSYKIKKLYVCIKNNFSLLHVKQLTDGELSIIFDLFSSDSEKKTFERKRIELNKVS
jgi:hypothetical protein